MPENGVPGEGGQLSIPIRTHPHPLSFWTVLVCLAVGAATAAMASAAGAPTGSSVEVPAVIDVEAAMRVAARRLEAHDKLHPSRERFPNNAKGAEWHTVGASDWVSGFYQGMLWYMYEYARGQDHRTTPAVHFRQPVPRHEILRVLDKIGAACVSPPFEPQHPVGLVILQSRTFVLIRGG